MFLLLATGCCLLLLGKAKKLGFVTKSLVCLSMNERYALYQRPRQTHEVCKVIWGISRRGMLCKCKMSIQAIKCFRAAEEGASVGAGHCAGLQCTIPKAGAQEAVEIRQLHQHHCLWGFLCVKRVTRVDFKEPLLAHL